MTTTRPALPRRQALALHAIATHVELHGFPPSIRELGQAMGVTSTATVVSYLRGLEDKGYIRRREGRARAIEVLV